MESSQAWAGIPRKSTSTGTGRDEAVEFRNLDQRMTCNRSPEEMNGRPPLNTRSVSSALGKIKRSLSSPKRRMDNEDTSISNRSAMQLAAASRRPAITVMTRARASSSSLRTKAAERSRIRRGREAASTAVARSSPLDSGGAELPSASPSPSSRRSPCLPRFLDLRLLRFRH